MRFIVKTLNPFNSSNPMTWEDAAKVSFILAVASYFTAFLLPYNWTTISAGYAEFIFLSVRFLGSVFFTNFIALAGLSKFTESKATEKKPDA